MTATSITLSVLLYLQCRRKLPPNLQPSQITGNRQGGPSDARPTSITDNYINIGNVTPEISTVTYDRLTENLPPGMSISRQLTTFDDDGGMILEINESADYTNLTNEVNKSEINGV